MRIVEIGESPTLGWLESLGLTDLPGRQFFHANPRDCSASMLATLGLIVHPFDPDKVQPGDVIFVPDNDPMRVLQTTLALLLGPYGCPWDKKQTHQTLVKHLIEETFEAAHAIETGSDSLAEELGDVLMQPILHGEIAARAGTFSTAEIAREIFTKLIRRHPHVFGDVTVSDSDEVLRNWDAIKKEEKNSAGLGRSSSILDGIPPAMPALARALAVSERAARAGFEWPELDGVYSKLDEEIEELRRAVTIEERESEIGDLLFTVVNLARWYKVDSEQALRRMLHRFTLRFQRMEALSATDLSKLSAEEWDRLWNLAKQELRVRENNFLEKS